MKDKIHVRVLKSGAHQSQVRGLSSALR